MRGASAAQKPRYRTSTSVRKYLRIATFSGALAGLIFASHAFAQAVPTRLEVCAAMADDRERLACYDRVARGDPLPEQERAAQAVSPQVDPEALRTVFAPEETPRSQNRLSYRGTGS